MKAKLLHAAIVALALGIAVPAQAADTNTVALDLIRRECSACHGPRGISVAPMFPNLAAQQAVYLETQLKAFRDRSRADPHAQAFMWGMAAQLTDSAITEIAAYYAAQEAGGARGDRRRQEDSRRGHSRATGSPLPKLPRGQGGREWSVPPARGAAPSVPRAAARRFHLERPRQ